MSRSTSSRRTSAHNAALTGLGRREARRPGHRDHLRGSPARGRWRRQGQAGHGPARPRVQEAWRPTAGPGASTASTWTSSAPRRSATGSSTARRAGPRTGTSPPLPGRSAVVARRPQLISAGYTRCFRNGPLKLDQAACTTIRKQSARPLQGELGTCLLLGVEPFDADEVVAHRSNKQ